MVEFRDYQWDAINRMHNGCILCGGVGSGKSITALGYYFLKIGDGFIGGNGCMDDEEDYIPMSESVDLYIITTARKRDTKEWEKELARFLLSPSDDGNLYSHDVKVVIDSWNNIGKYKEVKDAFFIFDEQRVVGYGAWVKAFLKIAKSNRWILLSATPGDTWMDYLPVFIANGYFRNKSDFCEKHVIYKRFAKFPQVDRYLNQGKLLRYKNQILVTMDYQHEVRSHHETLDVGYDRAAYLDIMRRRWNPETDMPVMNASELCYVARRVINSDCSRIGAMMDILQEHPKAIVFYNYDYELNLLKNTSWGDDICVAEWNGHKHEPVPKGDHWLYLVQYAAGAEGWNCIETNCIIFYSLNYSYKVMVQSAGRIDRMNTPFTDLYYYRLKSSCPLDTAISRALRQKKNFNENKFFS